MCVCVSKPDIREQRTKEQWLEDPCVPVKPVSILYAGRWLEDIIRVRSSSIKVPGLLWHQRRHCLLYLGESSDPLLSPDPLLHFSGSVFDVQGCLSQVTITRANVIVFCQLFSKFPWKEKSLWRRKTPITPELLQSPIVWEDRHRIL